MSELPPSPVCAVCRRLLWLTPVGGGAFAAMHGSPEDHAPVPRSQAELTPLLVCDFCEQPGIAWSYPCAEFTLPSPDPQYMGFGTDDDWAACGPCHDLIEAGDRRGLLDRAMRRWYRRVPKARWGEMRSELAVKLGGFDQHRRGDPEPFTPPDPRPDPPAGPGPAPPPGPRAAGR